MRGDVIAVSSTEIPIIRHRRARRVVSNRRDWATLPDRALPDGICLDRDGAIWVASPPSRELLRIAEGGEILDRIETEQEAIACMLGSPDRLTLYVCTADSIDPTLCLKTGSMLQNYHRTYIFDDQIGFRQRKILAFSGTCRL